MDVIFSLLMIMVAVPDDRVDINRGQLLFNRCKACHALAHDGQTKFGPTLAGLFSRKVGSLPGYTYSKALKKADFRWTPMHLNEWLEKPMGFLPGNRMNFAGIKSSKDRADLIAYLMTETAGAEKDTADKTSSN